MTTPARQVGAILAATEVAPADLRDVSELLEQCGIASLYEELSPEHRPSSLLRYVRNRMDSMRIDYWVTEIEEILSRRPLLQAIPVTDKDYPCNLKDAYDKPPLIWVEGTLAVADNRSLAIVGSRASADSSLAFAYETAREAASDGITVVSGLARGIDGAAHRGAVDGGGRTFAVLGAGIDMEIYPPEHQDLARTVTNSGGLISHFRPGSPPTKSSFVARNAVISGLSRASLIVEGGERSGTRTEAESALRQGRTVLLWAPVMANIRWARQFAAQPGVQMVTVVEEVIAAVNGD